MTPDQFQSAIDALVESNAPRVWSLIVTVFGDLAQSDGDAISGPVLSDILTPLGIKPEAMRVALHRLRNEGWLTASKQGRTSLHRLQPHGQALSAEARALIYRTEAPEAPEWHILCVPHAAAPTAAPPAYVRLAHGVFLSNTAAPDRPGSALHDGLIFRGSPDSIPAWVMQGTLPKGLVSELKDLHAALSFLGQELSEAGPATPLQAVCLRVLIVHRWRRLILKVPDVPDILFGDDWIGAQTRTLVHDTLARLPRPALSELA